MLRNTHIAIALLLPLSASMAVAAERPDADLPVSTLDLLLAGRATIHHPEAQPLWVSSDGTFQLSLRDNGMLDLRSMTTDPNRGSFESSLRRDLLLGLPIFGSLTLGLSAGVEFAPSVCDSGQPLLPCPAPLGQSPISGARLGAAMAGDGWQLDLSYMRRRTEGAPGVADDGAAWLVAPVADLDGGIAHWRGESLGLRGRFADSGWNLGIALEQWRLAPGPWAGHLLDLEHEAAAFTVGITRGALSGTLSSRVVHSDPFGQSEFWGGLDLGLSWRMPWQGEIQFGARNLVTRQAQPSPVTEGTALDQTRARTPYVRYHQDF